MDIRFVREMLGVHPHILPEGVGRLPGSSRRSNRSSHC